MVQACDFADEDTDVAPDPAREGGKRKTPTDEPSYELMWVEEEGYGMVLRVRRLDVD